jgi:competence protein ComEC
MLIYAISLLAGAWSLELLQQLPSTPVLVFGLLICGAGYCLPAMRLPCSFIAGFAVMGLAAEVQLDDQLDAEFLGDSVNIRARIHEFPQIDGESMRLLVRPIGRTDLPRILRLSWFQAQTRPVLGEVWQLTVRLRQPRGYSNPGGFDYEGWLFRQGIGATGYVVGEQHNYVLTGEPATRIDRMRRQVVRRIAAIAPHDDAAAVLMAIAVGARHEIGRSQWDLYASTGTSHLMAISGLHIGLAAGSAYAVSWFVFAPLFRRRNLRSVAILAAIMAATLYAGISGFAVPARRALLMAVIVAIAVLNHRRVMPAQLLGITALLIFLSEPLAILTPGFKLSFAAVAILFFVVGHFVTVELFTQPRFALQAAVGLKRLCPASF